MGAAESTRFSALSDANPSSLKLLFLATLTVLLRKLLRRIDATSAAVSVGEPGVGCIFLNLSNVEILVGVPLGTPSGTAIDTSPLLVWLISTSTAL